MKIQKTSNHPLKEDPIQKTKTNQSQTRWIIEENDEAKAHLILQITPEEAEIITLYTKKEARGKGHAKALLTQAIKDLKDQNIKTLHLEVRASNTPAINLYQSLHFTQTHTRKTYYKNPQEDALVYKKTLIG